MSEFFSMKSFVQGRKNNEVFGEKFLFYFDVMVCYFVIDVVLCRWRKVEQCIDLGIVFFNI